MKKVLILSATFALALGSVAYAADGGGGGGGGGAGNPACAADATKYCADKQGADRAACLRTNMDKLTDACKAAMAAGGGRGGGGGGGRGAGGGG